MLEHLNNTEKLTFSQNPHGSVCALIADCALAAVDKLTPAELPLGRGVRFDALYEQVRAELIDTVFTRDRRGGAHPRQHPADRESSSRATTSLALISALNDIKSQLEQLVSPASWPRTGYAQLSQLPRYLAAIETRLERLPDAVQRDAQHMAVVQRLGGRLRRRRVRTAAGTLDGAGLDQVRWMIEELRVSLFARRARNGVFGVREARSGRS